jgi:hypothetical protein
MSTPKITSADIAAFAASAVNLPKANADEMRGQVNTLRDRLENHIAANPGFSLVKMLHAGSVAKGTALRTVNDFDVAVYVKEDDAPAGAELVPWMAERLRDAYKGLKPSARRGTRADGRHPSLYVCTRRRRHSWRAREPGSTE